VNGRDWNGTDYIDSTYDKNSDTRNFYYYITDKVGRHGEDKGKIFIGTGKHVEGLGWVIDIRKDWGAGQIRASLFSHAVESGKVQTPDGTDLTSGFGIVPGLVKTYRDQVENRQALHAVENAERFQRVYAHTYVSTATFDKVNEDITEGQITLGIVAGAQPETAPVDAAVAAGLQITKWGLSIGRLFSEASKVEQVVAESAEAVQAVTKVEQVVAESADAVQAVTKVEQVVSDASKAASEAKAALPSPTSGVLSPGELGRRGEAVASEITGVGKNTQKFQVNGRDRIPDQVLSQDVATRAPNHVVEVKNVQQQSLTRQLRDDVDLVGPGGQVDVFLPPEAKVTGPLKRAFDNPLNPLNRRDLVAPK